MHALPPSNMIKLKMCKEFKLIDSYSKFQDYLKHKNSKKGQAFIFF